MKEITIYKNKKMKKFSMLLIITLSIVVIAGCDKRQQVRKGENLVAPTIKESVVKQAELVKKIKDANLGYKFSSGMASNGKVVVLAMNKEDKPPSLNLGVKQKYMESMTIEDMYVSFGDIDVVPQIDKNDDTIVDTVRVITEEGASWVKKEFEAIKSNPSEYRENSKDFGNVSIKVHYTRSQVFVTIDFE